jgi:hypothetical protein
MTEPITCEECSRAFGGYGAFRRGHVFRKGSPVRCRRAPEVARRLRLGEDQVWHYPSATDTGQLRFRLGGRGRPRHSRPLFFLGTAFPRLVRRRPIPPSRLYGPFLGQLRLFWMAWLREAA